MLEERRVQKAKVSLMRHPKFALLSGILMVGKTSVVDDMPTAATDGRDERYGREFVKELRDPELAFVVAHEAGHKMFRHLVTWRKLYDEDPALANMACDHVINLMLRDIDPAEQIIAMPKYKDGPMKGKPMGCLDVRFKGLNAKQVFDILKKERESGSGDCDGSGGGGGSGGSGSGSQNGSGGFDEHDWGKAKDMTTEERKELERDIEQAIRQGAIAAQKIAGAGAGGLARDLMEMLEPKINWREVLREFVKSICASKDRSSWRRVNRRFIGNDVYLPTLVGEKVGHLVIAIDTSGSVGGRELAVFLTEVKGIAEEVSPEKVDLIYWDSEVAAHEEYTDPSAIVQSTKPRGGGGTSPSCVSTYLNDKRITPEAIIVLTDGVVGSDWGNDWPAPVLWCITTPNITAANGTTLNIKDWE